MAVISLVPEKRVAGWFAGKPRPPLVFEDNQAAFHYVCTQQKPALLLEAAIPALVLERGAVDPDGVRHFLLRLAGSDGGRLLWACTLKGAPGYPEVGDLVCFRVVKIAPDLPPEVSVIGFIAAKLAPEWIGRKGWRVLQRYVPENIKPIIRW